MFKLEKREKLICFFFKEFLFEAEATFKRTQSSANVRDGKVAVQLVRVEKMSVIPTVGMTVVSGAWSATVESVILQINEGEETLSCQCTPSVWDKPIGSQDELNFQVAGFEKVGWKRR